MQKRRLVAGVLAAVMAVGLVGCGGNNNVGTKPNQEQTGDKKTEDTEKLDYTFGEGKTFHSDEPVTYSLMYSDHENYPLKEDWLLWKELEKKTNVKFEFNTIARADYDEKKALQINTGKASYIIPKTYDESAFVSGGAVVPVSDYVQYMPNYSAFVKKYNMEDDLKQITQEDGKYYRLPGMWEQASSEYSWVIRKDVFEKAGVDITALEKDMTWDTFYDALKKVQEANPGKTVWSDRWKGDATLNVAANAFNVTAGWGLNDGMWYDDKKDEFYFAETSDNFKQFVTYFNKLVKEGIMDQESFTQEDDIAKQKFYNGDSFVICGNKSEFPTYQKDMEKTLGKDNFELYMIVQPAGPAGAYQPTNQRLENGIMISQKALDDLGEEGFIKMMRFIDWLWYSEEGQVFTKWGVEGETYTKESDGTYKLKDDIGYGNLNPTASKALNVDYGFSNGVFSYGGTEDLALSMLDDSLRDYFERLYKYRQKRPLSPAIASNEDEKEQMQLIKTPLMDYVKTTMLQFITGQKDIEKGWDEYVKNCEANNSNQYVEMYNEIYERNKSAK